MQRIAALDTIKADADVRATLDAIKAQLGTVPNIFKTMARAPAVLNGFLSFSGAVDKGELPATLRERIALASAQTNGCDYCASAHQALGKMAGLSADEIANGLNGRSADTKAQAALTFAQAVLAKRGKISDTELAVVKAAGYSDGQVLEIVASVVLNIFTNYFNNVADTDIDFPRVNTNRAA